MTTTEKQGLELVLESQKELQGLARQLEKLLEASGAVVKADKSGKNISLYAAAELAATRKRLADLGKLELPGLVASLRAGLEEMAAAAKQSAERELVRLLGDLETLLKDAGFTLSGHYPELLCGVFTIVFETTTKGMTASLYYGPRIARLATVPGGDVEKIAAAVVEATRELEESLIEADSFHELLHQAWTQLHARRGNQSSQGPLPILEVLAELCFARQTDRFRRNPVRAAFQPYGQVSFSYQLQRQGRTEDEAQELVLGIATREDVKKKESLWIPRKQGGLGTHYSTLTYRRA
jgi:ElaB/YqjD/DUF883 family membrane-anchored ribosome-binding protein